MKKSAYTFLEQIIAIIVIGILCVTMMNIMRPNDIKADTLRKIAGSFYIQLEFATKSLLVKDTNNHNLLSMFDSTGVFSIESTASTSRMVDLYKKHLYSLRNKTLDIQYSSKELNNGIDTLTGIKPSDFEGFFVKNGAYFGVKLLGNCTSTIDYIYDPSRIEIREIENVCGLIFFDINEKNDPNILGIDQYIIPLGKFGVK